MSIRTIMIFPKFENMEIIDNIRKLYDPLAELVAPHITLVFPFESHISNDELSDILKNRLSSIKPFQLKLQGISKQEDAFGNYLFLNILQGAEEICAINKALYENEFKEFFFGVPFTPHMTIGKLPTSKEMDDAYNSIKFMQDTFLTTVDKISVEMIGDNDESIIIVENKLYD